MELNVRHLGAWQFEIEARGHRIACDQPEENGGFDEGMTPPELLLASLGSCAGYYAVEYLRRNKLAADGVRVRVAAEKAKKPARLDRFVVDVETPAPLPAEHSKGVEQAVHRCIIHATLLNPPKITTRIRDAGGSHGNPAAA